MTSDAVCSLAGGDAAGWAGLVPFPLDAAPACLGTAVAEGVRRVGERNRFHRDHVSDRAAVRLVADDDRVVRLVEVRPSGFVPVPAGEPEECVELPFAAYLQDPDLDRHGSRLIERVHARTGLAVLVTEDGGVVRLRGFEPAPAGAYVAEFLTFPPVEFGGPSQ